LSFEERDIMNTDRKCVDYARDCVRLAQLTEDQQIRDELMNMARDWMAQAIDEDKRPEPKTA
jgi:hypothetical protein